MQTHDRHVLRCAKEKRLRLQEPKGGRHVCDLCACCGFENPLPWCCPFQMWCRGTAGRGGTQAHFRQKINFQHDLTMSNR